MFLVTSPTVINVPTRGLLAVETMHAIVQWLENFHIKRNMTSMFINKKHRYYLKVCTKLWKFRSCIYIFHLCSKLIDEVIFYVLKTFVDVY